jgi:hypothetical protein
MFPGQSCPADTQRRRDASRYGKPQQSLPTSLFVRSGAEVGWVSAFNLIVRGASPTRG